MGSEGAATGQTGYLLDDDAYSQSIAVRPVCSGDGFRTRCQSDGGVLHKEWRVQATDKGIRADRPLFWCLRRSLRRGHVTHRNNIEGWHVEAISHKE